MYIICIILLSFVYYMIYSVGASNSSDFRFRIHADVALI